MEEQFKQQLVFEKNGNGNPQPLLPVINTPFPIPEVATDEWDLRQFLALVRRRAFVLGSVAIALSASVGFWTFTRQPKYEGGFQLLVEPVTAESKLEGLTQIPGVNTPIQKEGLDYDTQIQVLRSPELMAPIIQEIATQYPDIDYTSLLEDLRINRFQETKILDIRYQDSDPQKIEYILQQLAAGFLRYSLQERQTNLRQGIQFVDEQMPQLQERVNSLQRQLQQFRQEYNFIDPEVKAAQLSQEVSNIKLQRLETQKALAETRDLYAALQSRAGLQLAETAALSANLQDQSEAAQALNSSNVYQNLVAQLREVDSQIAAESTRFQEDSPAVVALRQKRENLLPVLRQEAQRVLNNKLVEVSNQISGLEVRGAQIAQADRNLNQQIQQLPTLARQYTDLQRELKVATESLNRFLEKRESLQIETAQKEIPWQTIAAPQLTQEDPISPNIQRNLILGVIAGLLAGMGAALLAERLDNVFHSPDDLKEITKLPLLGTIPFRKSLTQATPAAEIEVVKKSEGIQLLLDSFNNTQSDSYFPFLEAFRSLHTNINFLGSDTPIHSLVISSASHADGKSTVASHLAQAAAALGQKVLLVDADLRLPQVHNKLNLPNDTGLSNVLTTSLPVDDAIVRSPLWENLYVLTSGSIPPDPVKLLSSAKMQQIIAQLRQKFDLVIYDTPPMLGLADSSLIAPHTAGLIMVVRMDKTDRSLLAQALERLKMSPTTILGTVCNGVKDYNFAPYNYYYYKPQTQNT